MAILGEDKPGPSSCLAPPIPSFEEGTKVRTLLRSLVVLDGWLEENEGRLEDEVRVRGIKRRRAEALEQLRLELNRTSSP
jgi:hypothetical protein